MIQETPFALSLSKGAGSEWGFDRLSPNGVGWGVASFDRLRTNGEGVHRSFDRLRTNGGGDQDVPDNAPELHRSQQALEILEHQEQVIGVGWAGLELPGFVPLPRGIVLGVNQ